MFININLNIKLINFIICKSYIIKKIKKLFHYKHIIFKFTLLNLIYINLCKFFFIENCNRKWYFLLIINNFTQ